MAPPILNFAVDHNHLHNVVPPAFCVMLSVQGLVEIWGHTWNSMCILTETDVDLWFMSTQQDS
eukprot:5328674-Ditylum_brightwellii.AAC.1